MFKKFVDYFHQSEEALKPKILAQLKHQAASTGNVLLQLLLAELTSQHASSSLENIMNTPPAQAAPAHTEEQAGAQ